MRFIVAKNIRTDAVATIINLSLDDDAKREAVGKTNVAVGDFVRLQKCEKTKGFLNYVMSTIMAEGSSNPVDSEIASKLSQTAGKDFKAVLDGLWQRFSDKDEFLAFFPDFKIEAVEGVNGRETSFNCEVGSDAKAFSKLATSLRDFEQMKEDADIRSKCTALMQKFQRGELPVGDFERGVELLSESTSIMLDSNIDKKASEVWKRFDAERVFLSEGEYVCYKLEDGDKEDFIVVTNQTKWCVSHYGNSHWESYGAPFYLIVKGNHVPFALLNLSTNGASAENPNVSFKDETDMSVTYDRPSFLSLIEFGKKVLEKIGFNFKEKGRGDVYVFRRDIQEGEEPDEPNLNSSVASSRRTSPELLEYMALSNTSLDSIILKNPNCDAKLLRQLMWTNRGNANVLKDILKNEKCNDKLARTIITTFFKGKSNASSAYAAILQREKISPQLMKEIADGINSDDFRKACSDENVKTEKIVRILSRGMVSEQDVIHAIKTRKDLPMDVVKPYADKYSGVKMECLSMEVLSGSDIEEIEKNMSVEEQRTWAVGLVKNVNCPSQIMEKLLQLDFDDEKAKKEFYNIIAKHINATEEILLKLIELSSKENSVLENIVENPNADKKVFEAMLEDKGFYNSWYARSMVMRKNFTLDLVEKYILSCSFFINDNVFLRDDLSREFLADIVEKDSSKLQYIKKREDFMEIMKIGLEKGYKAFRREALCDLDMELINGIVPSKDTESDIMYLIQRNACPKELLKKAVDTADISSNIFYHLVRILDEKDVPSYYSDIVFSYYRKKNQDGAAYNLVSLFEKKGCSDRVRKKIYEFLRDENEYYLEQIVDNPYFTKAMIDDCANRGLTFVVGNPKCPKEVIDRMFREHPYGVGNYCVKNPKCTKQMFNFILEQGYSSILLGDGYSLGMRYMQSQELDKGDFDRIETLSKGDKFTADLLFVGNPHCTDEMANKVADMLDTFDEIGSSKRAKRFEGDNSDCVVEASFLKNIVEGMMDNRKISDKTLMRFIPFLQKSYNSWQIAEKLKTSFRMGNLELFRYFMENGTPLYFDTDCMLNREVPLDRRLELCTELNSGYEIKIPTLIKSGEFSNDEICRIALELAKNDRLLFDQMTWADAQKFIRSVLDYAKNNKIEKDLYNLESKLVKGLKQPTKSDKLAIPSGSDARVVLETTSNRKIINSTIASGETAQLERLMRNRNVPCKLARKFAEKSKETMDGYYTRFGLDDFVVHSVRYYEVLKNHGADFSKEELERIAATGNDDIKWLANKFIHVLYNNENGLYVNKTAFKKYRSVCMRVAMSEFAYALAVERVGGNQEHDDEVRG